MGFKKANNSYLKMDTCFNNVLIKVPLPSLTPYAWRTYTGYKFRELTSIQYPPPLFPIVDGFNGITTSNTNIYTYDSFVLKKWNPANGTLLLSATVNAASNDSIMTYGGLTSDECDHIFAGNISTINQYDGNLNLVTTIAAAGTIYDLNLDKKKNILYACGNGFVEAIQLSLPSCPHTLTDTIQATDPTCSGLGSATVTVTGTNPPFTYIWSNGQTGNVATGLTAGTYTVIIQDAQRCILNPLIIQDTITIVVPPAVVNATVTPANIKCNGGNNGNAIANASGGTVPYTYSWSNGQSTQTASGLIAGNYTVAVTDALGCSSTQTVNITQPPALTDTINSVAAACGNNNGSAAINVSGGTSPYTYNWASGQTTSSVSN